MSESSWTALAKGRERYWCSIESEGEVEGLEVMGQWSATESESTDPKGETRHRSARTKTVREEREKQKKVEMEVDDEAPQEASVKSEVRKKESNLGGIRRDAGLRTRDTGNQPEEMGFVPCALSIPRGPVYWCDNRCSDKTIRYWQMASFVVEDDGEAHTHNQFVSESSPMSLVQDKPVVKTHGSPRTPRPRRLSL